MLKKKSVYRRPFVILTAVVLLLILNLAVINNPLFATKVDSLISGNEEVTEMTVEESNAQTAAMGEAVAEMQGQVQDLDKRVSALERHHTSTVHKIKAEEQRIEVTYIK